MKSFYKKLISKTETQKEKDQDKNNRSSELLTVRKERIIPKLKTKWPRRWKRKK